MDRLPEVRTVVADGVALNTLLEKRSVVIHWIVVCAKKYNDDCLVRIFDGFDANGRLVFQAQNVGTVPFSFPEGNPCRYGLFVDNDDDTDAYTIAWTPQELAPPEE